MISQNYFITMKEKSNFKKKGFSPRKEFALPEKYSVSQINRETNGESVILEGIIDRIVQTPGPTIFYIVDGTGTLALKGFEGPGARAYPELTEGDAINVIVKIEEFRDELEGEIKKLTKLSESEQKKILRNIADIQKEKAKPKIVPFLVKSPVLEKLKDFFIEAATEIRLAVSQNRPIIVRHHNDTDGYSAGYSLEKAIVPLIEAQHGFGKSGWEFFTRAPCAAPFYEIEDSIKDTARSLSNEAKFSNKLPLIIIADNGSSQEDLLAIQQGKIHGIDFIVVDHHYFEKDVISKEVLVHINPWLVDEDGSTFSAGMLCTELARFINPVENINQIPALAGLADRINNPEVIEAYLKIAGKEGYDAELLGDLSMVIEFVSSKLRFVEAREIYGVLFGEPRNEQRALVGLLAPYIKKQEAKGLAIAKSTVKIKVLERQQFSFCILMILSRLDFIRNLEDVMDYFTTRFRKIKD
jgi:RecJ-like exonuclease